LQPFVDGGERAGATALVGTRQGASSPEALGFADVDSRKPVVIDPSFWIVSMSRPITATALMMSGDEGKVALDDPVERYLPEFRGPMFATVDEAGCVIRKKPSHPIPVREIRSQICGLPFSESGAGGRKGEGPARVPGSCGGRMR
jgi:CubicO group peptidase (beta-lactamase class C family)